MKEKNKTEHMDATKFYTGDNFGLLIDMRSMADQEMHGSGKRKAEGSGNLNCHVFVIADCQFNIMDRQLESVQN